MCGSANYWMPPALGIQRIDRETALARSDRGEGSRARGSKEQRLPREAAGGRQEPPQRGQPLFGSSEQPFHCLGSVSFDATAIVIQTTVVEDTDIKLRRGVAAFGGNKQVL